MSVRTLITIAAAGLALQSLPALAEHHEGPPPVGEAKPFSLPKIETYSLRNGLTVTLVPYGNVPKTVVRAVVRVGNLNDGDAPRISDMTGGMMSEGAGDRSAGEVARAAAAMGGDLNIGVGLDQTTVTMDVLSDAAPGAIELISDVLQRPTMPEAEFERVKQNALRDLSVAQSQPGDIATNAFVGNVYPDHPYAAAILPNPDDVGAITLDDVNAFHDANFGAARTNIYVVGKFDRRAVRNAIKKQFGKWDKGAAPFVDVPGDGAGPEIILVDRPGAVQSTIRLGKRVPPIDQSVDLAAVNTMLGGYFSSRITRNIREDKGYTYSPRSTVSNEYKASYWNEQADITSEATGPALTEIIKEITSLQTEGPNEGELQGVKNYMNGIFVIRLASRAGVAAQLSNVDLHGLGTEYLEKYVSRVSALTDESVQSAAATHLAIDDMTLVVVGDLATVTSQLEAVDALKDRLPEEDGAADGE